MQKSKDANSTQCSQAVSHPSTNRAQHCLTSVIGRELVYSMWYGRCQEDWGKSYLLDFHEVKNTSQLTNVNVYCK